jgi:4-hydroxybenzoate polyprenyltransferase
MTGIWSALRPKHWAKNLLIFIPLVFGQKLFTTPDNFRTAIAFTFFCMAASAVYLLNDLLDIRHDQTHEWKKMRPIASGKLGVWPAAFAAALLGSGAILGGFALNTAFGSFLIAYIALNVLYSAFLKSIVIVDVFCIGGSFALRVFAGGVAADVVLSHWLLFMIILLSLFLGFSKRRQELAASQRAHEYRPVLAKYSSYFIDQVISVLTSSIVVVYMLYTVDGRTVEVFGSNHLIYTIPFVYYGIFRYFYLMHRRQEGEDPVLVLFSDSMTQINLALWLLVSVLVIYFRF